MKVLYDDVMELRNRLSLDGSGEIYQEDHLLLDRVLDLLEKHLPIKRKYKLDWFKYDESDDLEEAIKYNIAVMCEQRLNGYYDEYFEELDTAEGWEDYIFESMKYEWNFGNGKSLTFDKEHPHLKQFGHDRVKVLIKQYVSEYQDIQPYIKKGLN